MSVSSRYLSYTVVFVLFIVGFCRSVQAAFLCCYKGSLDNPQITPLSSPLPLIENGSCIDTTLETKIFISGYNRNATSDESTGIISAYICKANVNTIYLDWADEAQKGNYGVSLGYLRAVKNTELIGKQLATALLNLAKAGLDLDKLHIIGHSLGAQISGITGNLLCDLGKRVARITGLDPAKPLYEKFYYILNSLNENSAHYVDIIHSDPRGYGIGESEGVVDFWPNNKGGRSLQPGCPPGLYPLLSEKGLCSHIRSWMYFIESIYNCNAFPAAGAPNYETWIKRNGSTDTIAYMGEYVSHDARGNFYLVTNDRPPYSKGDAGTYPNNEAKV